MGHKKLFIFKDCSNFNVENEIMKKFALLMKVFFVREKNVISYTAALEDLLSIIWYKQLKYDINNLSWWFEVLLP